MDNLHAEFRDFISSMIEHTLSALKIEDVEYGQYTDEEKCTVKKINEILSKLSSEDRIFMETHEMNVFHIAAKEQQHLYKQGYIDCVKLLKALGIM